MIKNKKFRLTKIGILILFLSHLAYGTYTAPPYEINKGGTNTSSTPTNGQVLIGNGSTYSLSTLTPDLGISLTNGSGSIRIGEGGGAAAGVNYLKDPSFEAFPTGSVWTTTSGTSNADTTNYTDGTQSVQVSLSSQQGNIAQSVTPSTQLQGVNLQATCFVKTSLTNIQLCSLIAGSSYNCTPVPSSNTWQPVTAVMNSNTNGQTIGVQIGATSSTTGTFNVDSCYVGKAVVLGSGFNTTDWAIVPSFTSSALGTLQNVNVFYRRNGDSLEEYGSFETGTVTSGTVGIPWPSGLSLDTTKAAGNNSQQLGVIQLLQTSGSNTQIPNASFGPWALAYNSGVSTSSLIVSGHIQSNVFDAEAGTAFSNNQFVSFWFKIPIAGWTSNSSAFRPDATPASWSGYQNGWTGGSSVCDTTSSSFADTTACTSIALTQVTNRNFGTVSTAGSSLPGISVNFPRAGYYNVCASWQLGSSGSPVAGVRIVDGSGIVINQGVEASTATGVSASSCGQYLASAASATTIKLQMQVSTGTGWFANTNSIPGVQWSIIELDAPLPAPYLTGSITSASTGALRMESLQVQGICSSNPCTITTTSTTGWATVAENGSGSYTLQPASGVFSAAPTCFIESNENEAVAIYLNNTSGTGTPTATSVPFQAFNTESASGTNTGFNVLCMGPH